jgi:hypothetical protein
MRMHTNEHHPLLNRKEFNTLAHDLGYVVNSSGNVFGLLLRHALSSGKMITAEDIAYNVVNRSGEEEVMVSVPNLGLHLKEGRAVTEVIKGKRRLMCEDVVQYFSESESYFEDKDTEAVA